MTLEEIKIFIAVDFEEDDTLIQSMLDAGAEYIENAGVTSVSAKASKLYEHALARLVGHWYDNREAYKTGSRSYIVPESFQGMIHQLRTCYP